jgi:hypothetical protein
MEVTQRLQPDAELSDPDLIRSPMVTGTEYDGPSSIRKKEEKGRSAGH